MSQWDYEPRQVYEARKAYLAQKRAQAPVTPSPLERPPSSYIEAEQQDRAGQGPPPFIAGALNALSYLERPAAAVRGFIGTPEDRAGAALRGLQQGFEAVPSGFELNRRAGIGLPTDNLGPLPFSPADVAGRATEMMLDPLSWVPGVGYAGKGAGILGSSLRATAPLAVDVARAPTAAARLLTRPAPQSVSQALEGPLPTMRSLEERMATNTQDTLGRSLGLTKVSEAFSPRAGDRPDELEALLHTTDAAVVDARTFVSRVLAPFEALKLRSTDELAQVFEGTMDAATLSNSGRVALPYIKKRIEETEQWLDATKARLAAVAPEAAAAPAFKFERLGNYFPRIRIMRDAFGRPHKIPPGAERGFQKEREFPTKEAGLAQGMEYEPDMVALRGYFAGAAQKVSEMELLTALAQSPFKRYIDTAAFRDTGVEIAASAHRYAVLREFEGVVNRGIRGEPVPPGTLRKVQGEFPELLEEAQKIGLTRPEMQRAEGIIPLPIQEFLDAKAAALRTASHRFPGGARGTAFAEHLTQLENAAFKKSGLTAGEWERLTMLAPAAGESWVWARQPTDGTYIRFLAGLRGRLASEKAGLDALGEIAKSERAAERTGRTGLEEVGAFHGLWFDPADARKIEQYLGREQAFATSTSTGAALGRLAQTIGAARPFVASGDVSATFLQNLPTLMGHPAVGLAAIGQQLRAIKNPRAHAELIAQHEDTINALKLPIQGAEYFEQASQARQILEGSVGRLGLPGHLAARGIGAVLDASERAWDMLGDASRIYLAEALRPMVTREGPEAAGQVSDYLLHITGASQSRSQALSPQRRAAETGLVFAPGFLKSSVALVGDLFGGQVARTEAANTLARMMVGGAWMYQHLSDALGQEAVWDPADARFMTIDVAGNRVGIGGVYRSLANLFGKVASAPGELLDWHVLDPENRNPLLRFWRGRASIPGQRAMDLLTHETYLGTPIDDNFGDLSKWVATGFLPFAIAGLLQEQGSPTQKAAGFAATLTGLRSFPEGRKDVQERAALEGFTDQQGVRQPGFGRRWDELDLIQQAKIRASREFQALPELPGARGAPGRALDTYFREWLQGEDGQGGVEGAARQLGAGEISGSAFRRRVTALTLERNAKLDTLQDRPPRSRTGNEQAYDRWVELVKTEDPYGRRDYDLIDTFLDSLPPATRQFIEDKQAAGLERLSPDARRAMQELRAARELLKPYREILEGKLRGAGIYSEWVGANPVQRDQMEKTTRFRLAVRLAGNAKERLRLRDRDVDAALVKWYGLDPIRQRRR